MCSGKFHSSWLSCTLRACPFCHFFIRLCTKRRLILWSADDLNRQVTGQGRHRAAAEWSAVGLTPSRASGTETKWRCRYMPAGLPRRSGAEMGATRPRPPAPIKNQQAISLRFFPGPYGSACVQHAEPSLAETRCIANKLLYRKISHCLVHSQIK